MNKYFLLCVTVLASISLSAADAPKDGYLSSTNASYDGSSLLLTGHVVLDHGLGKMTAEEASLEKQEAGKDFPFSLILLRKEVLLSLKSNGQILCDKAELDFTSLKGQLTAPLTGLVTYSDTLSHKGSADTQLTLQAPSIELSMLKSEISDKKSDYDVDTILAKDSVTIDYNKEFILKADHALYRKAGIGKTSPTKEFQGIITAYPKDASSPCTIHHGQDVIEASYIDLDLIQSQLCMHKPSGTLSSSLISQLQKGSIQFTSDNLTWDRIKERLTLKGKSKVVESSLGTILTEEEIIISQATLKGKKVVSKIETKGATQLIYQELTPGTYHKISCYGTMKIDREHLYATLTSPRNEGKRDSFAEQVYYEETHMGAYADTGSVEYSIEGERLQPVSLSLKGNICLFSREQEPFRCSIADRMTYSPSTKTLILSANPGQRVLFWDEQQLVRMSAQEVHLTQNPATQQMVIQGVGNVKFSLSTEENETLKKFFPEYKPLP